jgi:hypothetical protein
MHTDEGNFLAFHTICGIFVLRKYQHFTKNLWSKEFVDIWGSSKLEVPHYAPLHSQ